jgi:hypothetical protein
MTIVAKDFSNAQDFTIKILEGRDKGTVISLSGRALPYRGTTWETEQRIKTTYYPGNPVGTQQVMGPIDKNTVINGQWKDTFLGDGISRNLVTTFDGLLRSGASVEVSWGAYKNPVTGDLESSQELGVITRIGMVKRFKTSYDRTVQEVSWEAEFEWRGRDDVSVVPIEDTAVDENSIMYLGLELNDLLGVLNSWRYGPLMTLMKLPGLISAALDGVESTINSAHDALEAASVAVKRLTDLPTSIIERVEGIAFSVASMKSILDHTLNSVSMPMQHPKDTALGYWNAVLAIGDVFESSDKAGESASNLARTMGDHRVPVVRAEVWPVPGTDLRDLAYEFYGDADLWYVIADYNNLPSSAVPMPPNGVTDFRGAPIKIPSRAQGAQKSLGDF